MVIGDTVQVTGKISTFGAGGYGNQREIVPADASAIVKTTSNTPTPVTATLIHTHDAHYYAGQLVRMSARVVGARNYGSQVLITDSKNKNQGLVVMYIDSATGIAYAPLHGESVCVTGILEPYGYSNFPQRRFMEIEPRAPTDIVEAAC